MKRIIITFLFLLSIGGIQAQDMKIEFDQLQHDLIARTQPRLDLNDNPCAIVRVSAANIDRFSFEGNIVGDVIYSQGEALIYMPYGSKRLRIKTNDYGVVAYEFPAPLQKQSVYLLSVSLMKEGSFSPDKILEAEKVINRYLEVTGLHKLIEADILPPMTIISNETLKVVGQEEQSYENILSIDTLNKKMFLCGNGIALGRLGDKYYGCSDGLWLFKPRDLVEQYYNLHAKQLFGLNVLRNEKYLYTIGEETKIEEKDCTAILVLHKDNKMHIATAYFEKDTGLIVCYKIGVGNVTEYFGNYKHYGDFYLYSENKQVIPDKQETYTVMTSCCIGCPVDDSLIKKSNIRKAAKKKKSKK